MFKRLREAFGGRWHYVGHGINRDGERILNHAGQLWADDGGSRNSVIDFLLESVKDFCRLASRLCIRMNGNRPPELHLQVPTSELEAAGALGDTVVKLYVMRPDGKSARFHVRLALSDDGQVKATLGKQGKTPEGDRSTSYLGTFVDWGDGD